MSHMGVIRMHACNPVNLTVEEYERLQGEVRGRVLAGDPGISDVICLRLLEENAPRYHELKRIRELKR